MKTDTPNCILYPSIFDWPYTEVICIVGTVKLSKIYKLTGLNRLNGHIHIVACSTWYSLIKTSIRLPIPLEIDIKNVTQGGADLKFTRHIIPICSTCISIIVPDNFLLFMTSLYFALNNDHEINILVNKRYIPKTCRSFHKVTSWRFQVDNDSIFSLT